MILVQHGRIDVVACKFITYTICHRHLLFFPRRLTSMYLLDLDEYIPLSTRRCLYIFVYVATRMVEQ